MSQRTWIIEAPGKVQTLKNALREAGLAGDQVLATYGRLFDLDDNVDKVSDDILADLDRIEWKPLRKEQIRELRRLVADADEVIIATDPDLEGELIANHVRKSLVPPGTACFRAHLMGFSAKHLLDALDKRTTINQGAVFAAIARRLFDRHLGYQLVSKDDHFRMSMGRVITPLIQSLLHDAPKSTRIECELLDGWRAIINLPNFLSVQGETLCGILSALPNIKPRVVSVEPQVEDKKPLIGAEAILLCANELPYSVKEVTDALQDNYMKGRLSYPRTDSRRLGAISAKWAERMAVIYATPFDDRVLERKQAERLEGAFDAHEAVVPLTSDIPSEDIPSTSLSHADAVLRSIARHSAGIGDKGRTVIRESGAFDNDGASARWQKILKAYLPYLSFERLKSENGVTILSSQDAYRRPPNYQMPRTKLWRDPPDLVVARRMISLGLGRPSTISLFADKARQNYLDEYGQINNRGRLMLHKVKDRAPLLLKDGVAQAIEKALTKDDRVSSVAQRLEAAWSLLKQKPLGTEGRSQDHALGHEQGITQSEKPSNMPAYE